MSKERKAAPERSKPRSLNDHPSLKQRAVKSWLKRGVAIIPLAERGKVPLNKGGSRAPLRTWQEVEEAFSKRPNANYGLVTGAISQLLVVDVDGPEGDESLRALEERY